MLCPTCGKLVGEMAAKCESCAPLQRSPLEVAKEKFEGRKAEQVLPAGFWLRSFAYLIDRTLLNFLTWFLISKFLLQRILGVVASMTIMQSMSPEDGLSAEMQAQFSNSIVEAFVILGVLVLLILFLAAIYFAIFESSGLQASPGKLVLGIKVSDLNGRKVSFWRAFGRNIAKHLSAFTLNIGFLMAGFTARKQALHDMVASCLVIKKAGVSVFSRCLAAVFSILIFSAQFWFLIGNMPHGMFEQLNAVDLQSKSEVLGEEMPEMKDLEEAMKKLEEAEKKFKDLKIAEPTKKTSSESYRIDRFGNETRVVINNKDQKN